MTGDLTSLLGKDVSFTYTDGKTRIVRVEVIADTYLTGERLKNGLAEYRTYRFDRMTNFELCQPDKFFAPQFTGANAGRMG